MGKVSVKDYNEFDHSIGKGWTQIRNRGRYVEGDVLTSFGIVQVYAQASYTRLTMMVNGRAKNRVWNKWFGNKTIARLAREFACDVKRTKGGE